MTDEERAWKRWVDAGRIDFDGPGGCWNWQGSKNDKGYAIAKVGGVTHTGIHRVSYRLHKGPTPGSMHVHHKCDNSSCLNPDHLELIDPSFHSVLSAANRNGVPVGMCAKGLHDLTKPGARTTKGACRECFKAYQRANQARWRAERRARASA